VTDGRFTVQAEQELSGVSVVLQKDGLYRTCGELLAPEERKKSGIRRATSDRRAAGGIAKGCWARCGIQSGFQG